MLEAKRGVGARPNVITPIQPLEALWWPEASPDPSGGAFLVEAESSPWGRSRCCRRVQLRRRLVPTLHEDGARRRSNWSPDRHSKQAQLQDKVFPSSLPACPGVCTRASDQPGRSQAGVFLGKHQSPPSARQLSLDLELRGPLIGYSRADHCLQLPSHRCRRSHGLRYKRSPHPATPCFPRTAYRRLRPPANQEATRKQLPLFLLDEIPIHHGRPQREQDSSSPKWCPVSLSRGCPALACRTLLTSATGHSVNIPR